MSVDRTESAETPPRRTSRSATASSIVAALAVLGGVFGPVLSHFRVLSPLQGFGILALSLFLGGLTSVLLGGIGLVRTRGGRLDGSKRAWRGLLTGAALLLLGVVLAAPGRKVPPIHDITTTPDRAPRFEALAQIPENIDRNLDYPNGGDVGGRSVTELQIEAYPDLAPLHLDLPPAKAFEECLRVAEEMGWQIEKTDPTNLRFEAFDETLVFRFVDDVVVEVEPWSPGASLGSKVHVRSTSRVGQSDLGKNAERIRAFGAALAEFATSADAVAAAGPRLYVFDCGLIQVSDPSSFSLTAEEAGTDELFVPCYLIEHANGLLLWDAGLPANLVGAEPMEMSGMIMTLERSLVDQLADLHLEPKDIDRVAFSHMHFDHVGQANPFAGSTLLIQRIEHEAAFAAEPLPVFDPSLYSAFTQSETILLDGDHDVFGDGTVEILSTPGHTPGHQSLLVRLDSGPVVLSGDLYHFPASRELERVPVFNTSEEETRESMRRIEELLEAESATLWIEHDAALAATLAKAPAFHD